MEYSKAARLLAKYIRENELCDEEAGLRITAFCDEIGQGETPRMALAVARQIDVLIDQELKTTE